MLQDHSIAPVDPAIDVSVIVVSWNTREILRGCLASIERETRAVHEVIVVDNASSDGSAEMVAAEFPTVRLFTNDVNRGFAAANNQGLRIAQGRHVLLLNPDTLILDGAIDTMLGWLNTQPGVGCVGCQVWEDAQTIQLTSFADPSPTNLIITELGLTRLSERIPLFRRPFYFGWDRRSEREVDVVSGMFMLTPRSVVEKVGLLDEDFFVYAEEADWCRRIREAGYRCVFAPVARILHLDGGSKSTTQIRSKMYVQLQKSHLIYVRKHHGAAAYAVVKCLYIVTAVLRRVVFGAKTMLSGDDLSRARVRLARAALGYHISGREPNS